MYHILVVDDEEMIRKLIAKYAVYEGHTVTEAENGMEAVELCRAGGFDLMIIYEDRSLRDIATFVTEKIATMEGVLSTTTHFILKKYKANGIIYDNPNTDDRQAIIL